MTDTLQEPPKLYAAAEPIFPRRVKGKFRTLKWWIMGVTLAIYYLTPWIRWDRGPALPDQAVLIDLANRRFYFFFIEIWPHEFYFVAGLLIMAGLGLFLFTVAPGARLVRLHLPADRLDRPVHPRRTLDRRRPQRPRPPLERALGRAQGPPAPDEMDRLAADRRGHRRRMGVLFRRRADAAGEPLHPPGARRRLHLPSRILTATTFVFGGFMREQVCIYMCPWPRIQGAMMDEETHHRRLPRPAGRAARQAPQVGRGREPRRLHRLQRLRQRLPDGHRHPRRPAARLHHLRALHRRLRRRHGQDRQAARPDRLHHPRRGRIRARGQPASLRSGRASSGPA